MFLYSVLTPFYVILNSFVFGSFPKTAYFELKAAVISCRPVKFLSKTHSVHETGSERADFSGGWVVVVGTTFTVKATVMLTRVDKERVTVWSFETPVPAFFERVRALVENHKLLTESTRALVNRPELVLVGLHCIRPTFAASGRVKLQLQSVVCFSFALVPVQANFISVFIWYWSATNFKL